MDARPQRPLRGIRVLPDENTAPAVPSKQTLHQRHKSTGTLSNMIGVGGLKAAAKRTAFGDVSNTVKNLNTAHDDSVVGKQTYDMGKPALPLEKSAAFMRPAQRPLSAMNLKGPLTHTEAVQPQPLAQALPGNKSQAPALKRTLSKKATSIYKDPDTENVQSENAEAQLPKQDSAVVVPIAPVHQNLGPRQYQSQPHLKQDQHILRRTQSKLLDTYSEPSENPLTSDAVYEDAPEQQVAVPEEPYQACTRIEEEKEVYEQSASIKTDAVDRNQRQLPPPPGFVSEPEEYWDDEGQEEEIYDEQGYTTAHSYRSHGENTTGGVTNVLMPKVNNKIRAELEAAKQMVESARSPEEIEDEMWDTSMVAEYGDEIFAYMRELEAKMLPNAHYMELQTEIQWSMRSVLMDWLIQVHHRFSLLPETLFLCVNYIDRFLSCKIVSLGKLQLVGATAIFVAAKYEEINCPSVNEIVYMVDGGYSVDEILKAERFMLSMLQFELGWPGPMSFLRRISKADDYDLETRTLAKYFLEVTIMDERFVGSPPSYVAAGAHCFARMMLRKGQWSPAHVYYSGYTWTQLRPLVSLMKECCVNPAKHHNAVYEKYKDRRYKRASSFVEQAMQGGFVLPPAYSTRLSLPPYEPATNNVQFEPRESFKNVIQVKG